MYFNTGTGIGSVTGFALTVGIAKWMGGSWNYEVLNEGDTVYNQDDNVTNGNREFRWDGTVLVETSSGGGGTPSQEYTKYLVPTAGTGASTLISMNFNNTESWDASNPDINGGHLVTGGVPLDFINWGNVSTLSCRFSSDLDISISPGGTTSFGMFPTPVIGTHTFTWQWDGEMSVSTNRSLNFSLGGATITGVTWTCSNPAAIVQSGDSITLQAGQSFSQLQVTFTKSSVGGFPEINGTGWNMDAVNYGGGLDGLPYFVSFSTDGTTESYAAVKEGDVTTITTGTMPLPATWNLVPIVTSSALHYVSINTVAGGNGITARVGSPARFDLDGVNLMVTDPFSIVDSVNNVITVTQGGVYEVITSALANAANSQTIQIRINDVLMGGSYPNVGAETHVDLSWIGTLVVGDEISVGTPATTGDYRSFNLTIKQLS